MELNELTPKQRKLLKIIIQDDLDIGHLINEGISHEDAIELKAKGVERLLNKKIGATSDDLDS